MVKALKEYLIKYGWHFQEVEDYVLLTGFDDEEGFFYPMTISVKEDLVTLMCTFQTITKDFTARTEQFLLMLRFNFAWPLVKIGLDEDYTLALTVDIPKYNLSYESFKITMDIFVETAQMFSLEFQQLIKRE